MKDDVDIVNALWYSRRVSSESFSLFNYSLLYYKINYVNGETHYHGLPKQNKCFHSHTVVDLE